jgi:hypothetical protein
MAVFCEFETIGREMAVACCEHYPEFRLEELRKTTEMIRIIEALSEIIKERLSNTSRKLYSWLEPSLSVFLRFFA